MDDLQLYTSYTVLTIVASSVAIVALSFWPGSTSKQIALIGELRTSVERARNTCERARSVALFTAEGARQLVGMGKFSSFGPEQDENGSVDQANRLIQALAVATADGPDLRVSALRRRLAEVRRIEADGHALLSALDVGEEPIPIRAELKAHASARFQRLVA
jgi:hypothetical protein